MTVWEVHESIRYIHNKAPRWQSVLRLLAEFHRIATSVIAHYRDLSMHDVIEQFNLDRRLADANNELPAPPFVPLDQKYRRGGGGSLIGGAGLPPPVDATLDDWCQYVAHHFRPGGVNSPNSITMDLSYRVSYASVWGMLLLRFLHPTDVRNYYGRYLAGIAFRPLYYTDYIEQWNRERMEEPPIVRATGPPVFRQMLLHGAPENLSELDVIRHLAACGITQGMIDSTYPWAVVWVDQHTSVHFRDHFQCLEVMRQERIDAFGEPEVLPELQGWWTPDIGDTHRIHVLLHQELYGHHGDGQGHLQENPSWLLRGESTGFRYTNTYPPTTPGPRTPAPHLLGMPEEDEPMAPTTETSISPGGGTSDTELNGSAEDENMVNMLANLGHPDASPRTNGVVVPTSINDARMTAPMATETSEDSESNISTDHRSHTTT